MPCRILICEENKYFRQSLLNILLSRFSDIVIKVAEDTMECLRELQECSPHIFFMNLYRKGEEKFGLIRHVREKYPAVIITKGKITETDLRDRPLERRRKKISLKDQRIEKEYLLHKPERRGKILNK
jgi:DNA-binding NtrC family response regulator